MNRQRAKELLPIIQAFAEGKEIQVKMESVNGWLTSHDPQFDEGGEWRVRREPREFWVVIYTNGCSCSWNKQGAEEHLADIQRNNPKMFTDAYVAKVREVLDD